MSVIFDQLRISDDGKKLYINLHVNTASYFDYIYLKDITIMTADKVSETAPQGVIIDPDTQLPTDCIYYSTFEENQKEAAFVLQATDFNELFTKSTLSEDLFFVYVRVQGIPDPCTPCALDKEVNVGVTFDENLLFQRVMDFTRQLASDCTVPQGFTDFILQWNAFKAAVETEHYIPAIKFYNMLFGNGNNAYGSSASYNSVRRCGCHG